MFHSNKIQKKDRRKYSAKLSAVLALTVATVSALSAFTASEASAKRICIEINGNKVCGGQWGGGRDRDRDRDRVIRPKPPKPARLPVSLRTNEREDIIEVSGRPGNGKGKVRICLRTARGMWKKRLFIQRQSLNSEDGQSDCDVFATGRVRIALIKAKFGGKLQHVGIRSLNLTGWGGGRVTINWLRD